MHVAKVALVVYFDLRDFLVPLHARLRDLNFDVPFFPLLQVRENRGADEATHQLVNWLQKENPQIVLWVFQPVPENTFRTVVRPSTPRAQHFFWHPEVARYTLVEKKQLEATMDVLLTPEEVPNSRWLRVQKPEQAKKNVPRTCFVVADSVNLLTHPLCSSTFLCGIEVLNPSQLRQVPAEANVLLLFDNEELLFRAGEVLEQKKCRVHSRLPTHLPAGKMAAVRGQQPHAPLVHTLDQLILRHLLGPKSAVPNVPSLRAYLRANHQLPWGDHQELSFSFDAKEYRRVNGLAVIPPDKPGTYLAHYLWQGFREGCLFTRSAEKFRADHNRPNETKAPEATAWLTMEDFQAFQKLWEDPQKACRHFEDAGPHVHERLEAYLRVREMLIA